MSIKIEDIRFSSSAVDDFFHPRTASESPSTQAGAGKIRIAGLHQLAGFEPIADDKLVRLSKMDFWRLGEDDDGPFIERLVDDTISEYE
jgi:hypothetical protein